MSPDAESSLDDDRERNRSATYRVSSRRLTGYLQGLDLRKDLMALLDQGHREIILDLSDVELISSSIIGTLIGIHRDFWSHKTQLVLANVHPGVREVMATTRVDELFRFRSS